MIALRHPDTIESELLDAERDLEGRRDALDSWRSSELRQAGEDGTLRRSDTRSRTSLVRDAAHGRLTNGYALGHAYAREDQLRAAWLSARSLVAELRAELAVWRRRLPVGMLEIAELLGYSAEAPRQWKRRNVLPTCAGMVSGTPYWWRSDVLTWALEHGRTRAILPFDEPTYDEEIAA